MFYEHSYFTQQIIMEGSDFLGKHVGERKLKISNEAESPRS